MTPSSLPFRRLLWALLPLFVLALPARLPAQPAAPPPPKEYRVQVRYRIRAAAAGRLAQYHAMIRFLESIGFQKDPGPESEAEDPDRTRMTGTIAAGSARRILEEPHVQAILLTPVGYEAPAEAEQPVHVQLWLKPGLPLVRQRLLAQQVATLLRRQGFQEAVGYDNRGHTRLVGTIPAGNLDLLLEDLRWQGSGWLVPQTPAEQLPSPIRNSWPLLIAEVTPEPADVAPVKNVPPPAPLADPRDPQLKIARDLRALPTQDQPTRVEVILAATPADDERAWRLELNAAAPDAVIEGRLGPIVTVRARPDRAGDLARLPGVRAVRLPRPASVLSIPAVHLPRDSRAILAATGLESLHGMGIRGQGVRVAVIAGDFQGYQPFVGKQLPAGTHLVDLTAACAPSIEPVPSPPHNGGIGSGTQYALALALAAPAAELTLIRIDPEAPYQLQEVNRYLRGERGHSDCLDQRSDELTAESHRLQQRRQQLLEERRRVLDTFGQDPVSVKRREAYFRDQAELDRQIQEHQQRQQRFLDLVRDLDRLKGIPVVACGLVWEDGYPVDGTSALSRTLDRGPCPSTLWFQAAGDAQGQGWAGLFRDVDGNGVLEFAPPDTPLRPERWTRELNFLAWKPVDAGRTADLPEGRYRISVQWREPHDPAFWQSGQDFYPLPLADVQLLILRQRDPSGTRLPADAMEVVARSEGAALPLDPQPSSAMYEQTVEFSPSGPGHYALRVEARVPASIRPVNEPTLPTLEQRWELQVRLFVRRLDDTDRLKGRPLFGDYATAVGSVGMPADARQVISVGAVDASGRPEPYSALGPAFGEELRPRPDTFAFDELPLGLEPAQAVAGTGVAAAFAAGTAASGLRAGIPPAYLFGGVRRQPGSLLRLPAAPQAGQAGISPQVLPSPIR